MSYLIDEDLAHALFKMANKKIKKKVSRKLKPFGVALLPIMQETHCIDLRKSLNNNCTIKETLIQDKKPEIYAAAAPSETLIERLL